MVQVTQQNRFLDLLDEIPKGNFYDAAGLILPLQDSPHELRFVTSPPAPNTKFAVFVNEVFNGVVVTDAQGIVVVKVRLNADRHQLRLENDITGGNIRAYIDVRNTATWHVAYAESIENIDFNIDDTQNGRLLDTARSDFLEDVFGRLVRQPNDLNYDLETYRRIVRQLRQVYRHFGGRESGLFQAIASFTQVNPVLFSGRGFGPKWILGTDLLLNGELNSNIRLKDEVFPDDLPNINDRSFDLVHAALAANAVNVFPGPFTDPPIPQRLVVTFDVGWDGGDVTIVGKDELGVSISDTFTSTPGSSVFGVEEFAEITSTTKSIVGVTTNVARIGVADSKFITIIDIGDYNPIDTTLSLDYNTGPDSLDWQGNTTNIPSDGIYVLEDPPSAAKFVGLAVAPYDTATDNLNQLFINIDNIGTVQVGLTSGGAVVAATIAADINNSFIADPRYSAAYNSVASVLTSSTPVVGDVIVLTSPTTGETSEIKIENGPFDAAIEIFGVPKLLDSLTANTAINSVNFNLNDSSGFPFTRSGSSPYKVRIGRGRRIGAVTGDISGPGGPTVLAIFTDSVTPLIAAREMKYGWVLIRGAVNSNNNGYHKIVNIAPGPGFDSFLIINGNGISFTTESNLTYDIYIIGDVIPIQLNDQVTNQLKSTAAPIIMTGPHPANSGTSQLPPAAGLSYPITLDPPGLVGVVFGGSWDGGNILINGTDPNNNVISETIGSSSGKGLVTTKLFKTITNSTKTLVGASTDTATIYSGVLYDEKVVGDNIELDGDYPIIVKGKNGIKTLTVGVDLSLKPSGVASDLLTFRGSLIPDGWESTNVDLTVVVNGTGYNFPGYLQNHRLLVIASGVGDASLEKDADILQYKGLPIQFNIWVQQSISASENFVLEVSFDDGSTFSSITPIGGGAFPISISGTVYDSGDGPLCPQLLAGTTIIPIDATSAIFRIRHVGSGAGDTFFIEKATIIQPNTTGLFTGSNTIPRAQTRSKFRELLYVWSPTPLTEDENTALGLFQLPERVIGHIDLSSHAHGIFDRFDVTEYDTNTPPNAINLVGIFNENDWLSATLTNMQVILGTPDRFSAIVPIQPDQVIGEVLSVLGGPNTATLAEISNNTGPFPQAPAGDSRLYEDGIPIPENEWRFNSATEIEIIANWNSNATYTIDYLRLTRAESPAINLTQNGATFEDYLWFLDYFVYTRIETDLIEQTESQQVIFQANYTASIDFVANLDKTQAILTRDDGITRRTVPSSQWNFVNVQTIRIASTAFDPNSIYTFEYIANIGSQRRVPNIIAEVRTASTQVGLSSEAYIPFRINDIADTKPTLARAFDKGFVQFRFTFSEIVDVRDIILYSMSLKGLRFFGSSPNIPGLIV